MDTVTRQDLATPLDAVTGKRKRLDFMEGGALRDGGFGAIMEVNMTGNSRGSPHHVHDSIQAKAWV
jgi:hypothetical protein